MPYNKNNNRLNYAVCIFPVTTQSPYLHVIDQFTGVVTNTSKLPYTVL